MIYVDITPWDSETFTAETLAIKVSVTADSEESEAQVDFSSYKIRIEDISEVLHRNDDAVIIVYESGNSRTLKITEQTQIKYMGEAIATNEELENIISTIAFGQPYTPPPAP